MADWLPKETRSKIMSTIHSKNTKPEIAFKKAIRGLGFVYQPKIKGSPDFINRKKRIAIFVHGCFWHKCPRHYKEPKSKRKYWLPKIEKNIQRDRANKELLKRKGYSVIEIWEHQIKNNITKITKKIQNECTKKQGKR